MIATQTQIQAQAQAQPQSSNVAAKRTRRKRPESRLTRTNLLQGNYLLYDERENLKLFSEPSQTGRKGVIFENNTKVMDAFPKVQEIVVQQDQSLEEFAAHFPKDASEKGCWYDHHEGALIRLYHTTSGWQVSTQKKIDAFRSRWSGRQTFGDLWSQAILRQLQISNLGEWFNTLQKDHQYLFLIRHNEDNRFVCQSPAEPTTFHVGTFVDKELLPDHDIGVEKPKKHTFGSAKDLMEHVQGLDHRQISGCIGCWNGNWYKIQSETYKRLENVRGNEPSLRFRYLQTRLDGATVQDLYELYPKFANVFDECEDTIYSMAKFIHTAYLDRFVRRQYVSLEREFFNIMRICHEWHKEDRQHNKVTLDKVIEVINTRYDHVLNKMIRMYNNLVSQETEI